MKYQMSFLFRKIPVLFLLPYVLTMLFQGSKTAFMNRYPDVETCLPVILAQEIDDGKEKEAIKAQAVITRTNLYEKIQEGENLYEILKEARRKREFPYMSVDFSIGKYEKAAQETKDCILTYKGELKHIPYHEISAGTTRDGAQVFRDSSYTYLKSVDSSQDKNSPDYLSSVYIEESQMPKELVVEERDEAGYVLSLRADGNLLEGEAFCQGMHLSSSNFTIQKVGDKYRFLCKGKGHGIGFSQYGGSELAKEGKNWEKILEIYFPEMMITNVFDVVSEKRST